MALAPDEFEDVFDELLKKEAAEHAKQVETLEKQIDALMKANGRRFSNGFIHVKIDVPDVYRKDITALYAGKGWMDVEYPTKENDRGWINIRSKCFFECERRREK